MARKPIKKQQNKKQNWLLWGGLAAALVIIVALIFTLGGNNQALADNLPAEISTDQAHTLYEAGDVFFLDVREMSEWNEYHAPNTTLIPLGELAARVNEVPKDKPIVVICRSGNRSQQGRDILQQAGFTNVTSMAGGLKTWRSDGYPIVSGP
jgi:rhodanese-related sulfurtransferase